MAKKTESYLGNPNLKKAGVHVEWTQEMLNEWEKCYADPVYFTEKYVRIIHVDRGVIPFVPYDYQKEIIETIHEERFTIVLTGRQSGKALALDEKIPTPTGFKLMGDLVVGDTVYDNYGNPTKITLATDIMYNHKCYDITFDNGEVIKCDAEHLWVVEVKNKQITKTTEELVDILFKQKSHKRSVRIQGHNGVDYPEQELDIPPYVMGYWLGDGYSDSGRISIGDFDYEQLKENFKSFNFEVTDFVRDERTAHAGRCGVVGLTTLLNKNNLLKNKKILDKYLISSKKQRIELIQGLMDSDGNIDKKGSCEFYNKNEDLIDSFRVVLSSLGVKSTKRPKTIKGEVYFTVSYTTDKFNPVLLKRKVENLKTKEERNSRTTYNDCYFIKSIVECESVPVRCIKVDAPDSMFLASKSFIPTHNTTSLVSSILHYILFNDDKTVALLANKGDTAREILNRIQIAYELLPKWMQQGVVEYNKGNVVFENKSRIIAGSTSSSSIRGYSISFLYIDECVGEKSEVTVRDKLTGEIKKLSIEELYDEC